MRKPGKIDRNHTANLNNYLQDCIAIKKICLYPSHRRKLRSGFGPVVAGRRVLIYLNDRSRGMFAFIGWGIGETKKKIQLWWEKHAMISYQLHPLKTWSERLRDLQIKGAAAVKTHLFHFNSFLIYNPWLKHTCMFWVRCRISVTYSGKEKV